MSSQTIEAFALCWPADPNHLLFKTAASAEENRKWFKSNYKIDRNGNPRGEPFIVKLTGAYDTARNVSLAVGSEQHGGFSAALPVDGREATTGHSRTSEDSEALLASSGPNEKRKGQVNP